MFTINSLFNFTNFSVISGKSDQTQCLSLRVYGTLTSTSLHDLVVWCLLQHCIKGCKGTFLGNGREGNENCFDVCGSKHWKFAE
jgi:hypothetical protein